MGERKRITGQRGYRNSVAAVTLAAVVPYGFTLTIWGTGAIATEVVGRPRLVEITLFVTGALLGFGAVSTFARGAEIRTPTTYLSHSGPHFVANGVALLGAYGTARLANGVVSWGVVSFIGTTFYLLLVSMKLGRRSFRAAMSPEESPPAH